MAIVQQLSVFVKNEPGILHQMCESLAAWNINIRAISVSDTVDHAVVRLIVDDPAKALHILGQRGMLVVETDLLALELSNQPAMLAEATRKLAEAGVNVEYAYGSGSGAECVVVMRVDDLDKAESLFT